MVPVGFVKIWPFVGQIMTRSKSLRKPDRREGVRREAKSATPHNRGLQSNGGVAGIKLSYRHVALCGFVLSIFAYTTKPSVPGGDAGELLAEGCQFGISHPPGKHMRNSSL